MGKTRTAIITGGSRGIGYEIALALAKKKVNIVICSRNQEGVESAVAGLKQIHTEILGIKCNVAIGQDVESLVKQTLDRFGSIDILINNAGVLLVKKIMDTSEEEWNRVVDANLKGAFLCSKAVLPHMIANNSGTIINVACGAGRVGFENLSAYCASKFGMMGLTQSLAWEAANYNIRVMSICPGETATDMQKEADPEYYNQNKQTMLQPRYIAERIKYLIYDDIEYVNGHSEDIFNQTPRYDHNEE